MTPQELFDETVRKIVAQGKPSGIREVREHPVLSKPRDRFWCEYRSKDGRRCAVGLWIRDDKYSPEMENKRIDQIVAKYGEDIFAFDIPYQQIDAMLTELQYAHDRAASDVEENASDFVVEFLYRAERIAYELSLNNDVVKELQACPSTNTNNGSDDGASDKASGV